MFNRGGCLVGDRALTLQAEGWVFESQPRQTLVVKTGSDSSTAKRSAISVIVTGSRIDWLGWDLRRISNISALTRPRVLGDDHYKRMPRVVSEGRVFDFQLRQT